MYDSFVYGVKFLVKNSTDFNEHAFAIRDQMLQCPRYVYMRERGNKVHQLIIRQRPQGIMVTPYAGQTVLAQNMTDYPSWFDNAIAAILKVY